MTTRIQNIPTFRIVISIRRVLRPTSQVSFISSMPKIKLTFLIRSEYCRYQVNLPHTKERHLPAAWHYCHAVLALGTLRGVICSQDHSVKRRFRQLCKKQSQEHQLLHNTNWSHRQLNCWLPLFEKHPSLLSRVDGLQRAYFILSPFSDISF